VYRDIQSPLCHDVIRHNGPKYTTARYGPERDRYNVNNLDNFLCM
jgi:hypothetical protein